MLGWNLGLEDRGWNRRLADERMAWSRLQEGYPHSKRYGLAKGTSLRSDLWIILDSCASSPSSSASSDLTQQPRRAWAVPRPPLVGTSLWGPPHHRSDAIWLGSPACRPAVPCILPCGNYAWMVELEKILNKSWTHTGPQLPRPFVLINTVSALWGPHYF